MRGLALVAGLCAGTVVVVVVATTGLWVLAMCLGVAASCLTLGVVRRLARR